MDEARLIEKLRRIEALHAGATTPGERDAAASARQRILDRLASFTAEPTLDYKFSISDPWARQVFNALVRRYGLKPYRRHGQHRQTVMVKVSRRFVDETLWPEFQAISRELRQYLDQVTQRVIKEALDASSSEAEEIAALPSGDAPEEP